MINNVLAALAIAGIVTVACATDPNYGAYERATQELFEQWRAAINNWEAAANNPDRRTFLDQDARSAALRMESALSSWDGIDVPEPVKHAHQLVREAMNHERQAFDVMRKYYSLTDASSDEFQLLRREGVQLMPQKDDALKAAIAEYPGGWDSVTRLVD